MKGTNRRQVASLRISAVLAAMVSAGPGTQAWVDSVDVVPNSPSCDEQFTVSLEGSFGDGCWEVIGIDFVAEPTAFSFVVHAVDHWQPGYVCGAVIVPYSAVETVGPLPEGTYWLYVFEELSSLRFPEGDQVWETFGVCCSEPPEPVTDLRLEKIVNGYQLRFTWTDVAGVEEYLLYMDTEPDGAFVELVGIASTGATGIDAPVLFVDDFFLLTPSAGCPSPS